MFSLGKKELPLCKCGCRQQVERKTKKYFADHFRNPVGPPEEEITEEPKEVKAEEKPVEEVKVEKVKPEPVKVDATKVKKVKKGTPSEQLSLASKVVKAKTKPIPGGKISKQNLLNVGLGIYTC